MNNNTQAKISILLCYGLFEPSNLQYKTYLDKALLYLDDASHIIICGGLTKNNSTVSEAQSVVAYLIEKKQELKELIILEERSITTPQNLEFSSNILKEKNLDATTVTIICDSIRAVKVYYLALTHLAGVLNIQVQEEDIYLSLLTQVAEKRLDFTKDVLLQFSKISIQGIWIERTPQDISHQIISTMQEIGATRYPSIEAKILEYRKKQWQLLQSQE